MRPNDEAALEELLALLQRGFCDALLRGDEEAAELVVREAIDAQLAEGTIDDRVIAPALRVVGDLWADGALTIAEEHLATEIALRAVALQRDLFHVIRRRPGVTVVLAAAQGEQHVVGLRMAGSLLAHAGYVVKQLGADVPAGGLALIVARHRPVVVGLSVTMAAGTVALEAAMGAVQAAKPGTGVVLGGAGVPGDRVVQPGVTACEGVTDVVGAVDALVQRASMN